MNALERLQAVFAHRETAGPASEEQIKEVEEALSLKLPPSYRMFLAEYGAAWLEAPYEIDGIVEDPEPDDSPMFGNVIHSNLNLRRYDRINYLANLIYISSDGSECSFYLDTSRGRPDGECPVIAAGPEIERGELEIAPSFLEFVEKAANGDPLEGIDH